MYIGVSVRLQSKETANEDGRCVDDTSRHLVSWIRINTPVERNQTQSAGER